MMNNSNVVTIWKTHRLYRMEKAIGVHLTPEQRIQVLSPDRPFISGARRSGKTLVACMWLLFNRKEPVIIRNELNAYSRNIKYENPLSYGFFLPDPDVYDRNTATLCTCHLIDMWKKCVKAGIPVFELYPTYEKYLKDHVEEQGADKNAEAEDADPAAGNL